tara:strand:- start:446 stop:925 length:480 start_codon:yes stop_codon:yes gene_type:complete
MASNKLTDLTPITADQLSGSDPFYLVDISVNQSKKVLLSELFTWVNDKINTESPFLITATPGGSSSYSNDENIIYLSWSGGSGTYNLTLPSATDTPYRNIQIISDGTLAANDKVHVLAPVGERIDGVINPGFYALNKPFNGVTVWSDGTQWIVTQAKSS